MGGSATSELDSDGGDGGRGGDGGTDVGDGGDESSEPDDDTDVADDGLDNAPMAISAQSANRRSCMRDMFARLLSVTRWNIACGYITCRW